MSKIVLNYWPSLLLSLVLLTGIVACLKRLDYLVVEDVRALISIIFGFATSCLLLSFIWLIQRKPLNRTWSHRHITIGGEVPSLHPRGRANSSDSFDSGHMIISTISNGQLDIPPAYEDALLHSKPVHRQDKAAPAPSHSGGGGGNCPLTCDCSRSGHATDFGQDGTSGKLNCCATNHSSADDAKNGRRVSIANPNYWLRAECDRDRKISFVHLDAGQLALSSSPPKYHELQFNASNEPHLQRDGDKITVDMP